MLPRALKNLELVQHGNSFAVEQYVAHVQDQRIL